MVESDFIFEVGEPVDVGAPVENDFSHSRGELLSDGDESDLAFIRGRGLGPGVSEDPVFTSVGNSVDSMVVAPDGTVFVDSRSDGFLRVPPEDPSEGLVTLWHDEFDSVGTHHLLDVGQGGVYHDSFGEPVKISDLDFVSGSVFPRNCTHAGDVIFRYDDGSGWGTGLMSPDGEVLWMANHGALSEDYDPSGRYAQYGGRILNHAFRYILELDYDTGGVVAAHPMPEIPDGATSYFNMEPVYFTADGGFVTVDTRFDPWRFLQFSPGGSLQREVDIGGSYDYYDPDDTSWLRPLPNGNYISGLEDPGAGADQWQDAQTLTGGPPGFDFISYVPMQQPTTGSAHRDSSAHNITPNDNMMTVATPNDPDGVPMDHKYAHEVSFNGAVTDSHQLSFSDDMTIAATAYRRGEWPGYLS